MSAKSARPSSPAATPEDPATPWVESSNPRRRQIGQIVLSLLWIYVAAIWVLALDQWLNWGFFGPKVGPLP